MKQLLIALALLLTAVPGLAQKRGYTVIPRSTTVANPTPIYYVETAANSGTFITTTTPPPVKTSKRFLLTKQINLNYSTANAVIDFNRYGDVGWPDQFKFIDFLRFTQVPLATQLRQQQLTTFQSATDAERDDLNTRKKLYVEMGGGFLQHPTKADQANYWIMQGGVRQRPANGDLQYTEPFFAATVTEVLEAINTRFDPRFAGADRISFNFEAAYAIYPGSYQELIDHWPNADNQTIVQELSGHVGQTITITGLFNSGRFNAEMNQRIVNRHVALVKFVKAKVGAATLVTNGDFHYYSGALPFEDNYATVVAGNKPSYHPELWGGSANFPSTTVGGITVAGLGSQYVFCLDWMNMYVYPWRAVLDPADFDAAAANDSRGYPWLWSVLKPSVNVEYISLPAQIRAMEKKLRSIGRTDMPVAYQTHYRFENGVQRGADFNTVTKLTGLSNFPDEVAAPPYHNHALALLSRFSMTMPNSGLTVWRTEKAYPGISGSTAAPNIRPHGDGEAYRSAMRRLYLFREYFDPANAPQLYYLDDLFVRYPSVSGGNWGSGTVDGGNGFSKRNSQVVAASGNPSDARTKASVLARVITKNGQRWALILAVNFAQERNQSTTLDVRFRPAEVAGITGNVDVSGITVTGYDCFLAETQLSTPAAANQAIVVTSGTTSTVTSGTTTPPVSPTTAAYSLCIEAESVGGEGQTSASTDASGGQYVSGLSDGTNGRNFSITNVPTTGTFTLSVKYASGDNPTAGVIVNGATVPGGIFLPSTNSFGSNFRTVTRDITLNPGTNTLRIQRGSGGNFALDQVCVSRSGSVTPPVTTTTTPPVTPPSPTTSTAFNFDWVPLASTPQPADGKVVQTSSAGVRLESWLDYGASINHLSENGTGNIINHPDWGRQLQVTMYGGPVPFVPAGTRYTYSAWNNFRWDPIEAGPSLSSEGKKRGSPILAFGFDAAKNMSYFRTRPYQWALEYTGSIPGTTAGEPVPGEAIYDIWRQFISPTVIRNFYKITLDRNFGYFPDNFPHEAAEQEFPCAHVQMTWGNISWYQGDSPWTNSPVTEVYAPKQYSPEQIAGRAVSENWIACRNPNTNRGFGIVGPNGYSIGVQRFGDTDEGEWGGGAAYFQHAPKVLFDAQGVTYLYFDVVVGSPQDVRSYAYSLPRPDNRPDYVFQNGNRHGWSYLKCYDQGERNITDGITLTHITGQADLSSPFRAFAASTVPKLYIKIRNTSPRTDLALTFRKAGQEARDEGFTQRIPFTAPANDGLYHVIEINTANSSAWTGQIVQLQIIQNNIREETPVSGRKWEIKYVSYLNRN